MKHTDLISKMTLEEKASLCSGRDMWHTQGIERLGIPSLMMTDGPHGLRKQQESQISDVHKSIPSTCFPTASCVASSWDVDNVALMADTIAREALAEKVSIVLGCGTNIKRSPLCGRNFEYFSEDPLLSGKLASSFISNVEKHGIGTSLKHFCANNQESYRLKVSSDIDERALREIYLRPFEIATTEGKPSTLMCSYNKINGVYGSENEFTLKEVLRKEWGFKGFVMSDWGAVNNRVDGLNAGLELEMPGASPWNDSKIVEAVRTGKLAESVLDNAVELILDFVLSAEKVAKKDYTYDSQKHNQLSLSVAEDSLVLLKNDGVLPLSTAQRVLIIGDMAKNPRFQGGGSSHVTPTKITSALEALDKNNIPYDYLQGYNSSKVNKKLLSKALELCKNYKSVVIFAGLSDDYESEGFDRTTLSMPPSHLTLIDGVSERNPNTTVVLSCGSPVEIEWRGKVKGILLGYLAGQASGEACVNILYGKVCPSGRLAETFPLKIEDTPCHNYFPMNNEHSVYKESIFVGYRYYLTAGVDVAYPFGHGLSYTEFKYSNFTSNQNTLSVGEKLKLSIDIENIGTFDGKETIQIYVSKKDSALPRPKRELIAFTKVFLSKTQAKTIDLEIDYNDLRYYDTTVGKYQIEAGEYEFCVAKDCTQSLFSLSINVEGVSLKKSLAENSWYYSPSSALISDKDFFEVYGKEFDYNFVPKKKGFFDDECTYSEMCLSSFKARFITWFIKLGLRISLRAGKNDTNYLMALYSFTTLPMRKMSQMSGGKVSPKSIEGMVLFFNGKNFKALRKIMSKK